MNNNSKTNLSLSDSESLIDREPSNQSKIRIFLVDDQKTILQMLSHFLESEPDLEVIGSSQDSQTALQQIEKLHPELAIIDIEMPGLDGLAMTRIIQQRFAATKVLILSSYERTAYIQKALEAGAKGYLLKNTPREELVDAIRFIHKGYLQLGPGLYEKLESEQLTSESELIPDFVLAQDLSAQPSKINLRHEVCGRLKSKISQSLDNYRFFSIPFLNADRVERMGAKQKFNSGVKWIAWSAALAIVSTSGWLVYSLILNRSSGPVSVRLVAVEKDTVEDLINEIGIVELGGQQTLKSPVDGGIVARVLVESGDRVESGQNMVILRDPERQTALAQQQLEIQKQELTLERSRQKALEASQQLTAAQQELQALAAEEAEIRKQELQLARNREKVLESTDKLNAARRELQELKVLLEKGFIPENEFQEQEDQVLTVQSQLQDAKLAVETTALELQRLQSQGQSRQQELSNQILTAQAQLQDARLEVNTNTRELQRMRLEGKKIEQEIQKNLVRATFKGRVLDIKIKVGDVVELGDALLTLGDPSQELVKLQLSPLDAVRVRVNQTARINIIGPQAESFTGRVQSVSKVATTSENSDLKKGEDSGQATVTATVKLDRPSQVLIPGSKVDVEIVVAARQNVVALGRDVIQGSRSEAFVWVRDAQGKAQKRPVTLGLEGLTTVEVTSSGLLPGDRVIVPQAESPLKLGIPVIPQGDSESNGQK